MDTEITGRRKKAKLLMTCLSAKPENDIVLALMICCLRTQKAEIAYLIL